MINNYSVYEDGSVEFVTSKTIPPSLCPSDGPAITKFELDRLLAREERAGIPGSSHRVRLPFWWQEAPELPRYAADIPSPVLDILFAHDERMQRDNTVGSFCGAPIVTLDEFGMEVDREHETNLLCGKPRLYVDSYLTPDDEGYGKLLMSTHNSIPAEILPGEERCADGIIRRSTTAEVIGYDTYHNQAAIEAGQQRVSMADAKQASKDGAMVHYRPNRFVGEGEYALIQEAA